MPINATDLDADSDSERTLSTPTKRNLHAPQPCIQPLPPSRPCRSLPLPLKRHKLGKSQRIITKPPRQPTNHHKKHSTLRQETIIASFLTSIRSRVHQIFDPIDLHGCVQNYLKLKGANFAITNDMNVPSPFKSLPVFDPSPLGAMAHPPCAVIIKI